ncbi:argonaute PAZ domain-containing protein, partial [uncultured Thermosynechococcus sp.]|uniref:argonaute PAZ domain-containing protein n=1 Tax=uncultured Thermosynechococcus sp. TaxID=436945 RepID=UPI00260D24BD
MDFPRQTVVLNHFLIKELDSAARTVYCYTCEWKEQPDIGQEAQAFNRISYDLNSDQKLGVVASRWQSYILVQPLSESTSLSHFEKKTWKLVNPQQMTLDCRDPSQRQALESLQRSRLRKILEQLARQYKEEYEVDKRSDNSILFWKKSKPAVEHEGWQILEGRCLDVVVDSDARLYIEVDDHYHFHSPWTLQQWLDGYPNLDLPFSWVRNTYFKNNQFYCWQYLGRGKPQERPETVQVQGLNKTLAQYHLDEGATEEEIKNSQVVYVARKPGDAPTPHLSCRLTPILTLELLGELRMAGDRRLQEAVEEVFQQIRIPIEARLRNAHKFVKWLCGKGYQVTAPSDPVKKTGYRLPNAVLLAKDGQQVKGVKDILKKGCARVGEEKFGLLNLCTEERICPEEITKCLKDLGDIHGKSLEIQSFRTRSDMGEGDLQQQEFWQQWAREGVRTILVMMPYSPEKQRVRSGALGAGIATQFFTPENINQYKALNIVLGLLCKAKWQPIYLRPHSDEWAELIIGFDAGTNRSLYFGTPAFAILANGQSLGWELPSVQ